MLKLILACFCFLVGSLFVSISLDLYHRFIADENAIIGLFTNFATGVVALVIGVTLLITALFLVANFLSVRSAKKNLKIKCDVKDG